MASNFGMKLPVTVDENNNFIYVTDGLDNIKQKIKNIILTNPGEKLMNPTFGVGIRRYLFENQKSIKFSDSSNLQVEEEIDIGLEIKQIIQAQFSVFLTGITLNDVVVTFKENIMYVKILFSVINAFSDELELQIRA